MEVAYEWDRSQYRDGEMIALLAKFTEMPDQIKLYYLSKLMEREANEREFKAKEREEFKKILSSLPVELVSLASININLKSHSEY